MFEEIFLRRARMLLPWDECILFTQPYGGDDMIIDNGMIGTMHYAHHDLLNELLWYPLQLNEACEYVPTALEYEYI